VLGGSAGDTGTIFKRRRKVDKCKVCGKDLVDGVCPDGCDQSKAVEQKQSDVMTLTELDTRMDKKIVLVQTKIEEAISALGKKTENKLLQLDRKDLPSGRVSVEAQTNFLKLIGALLAGDITEAKAMTEGTDADGGYLVPTELQAEIVRLVPLYGIARRNCRIIPMGSNAKNLPKQLTSLTDYWIGEGVAATASKFTLGNVAFTAHKHGVLVPLTDELISDSSVGIVNFILTLIAEVLGLGLDDALFNGVSGVITNNILANADVTAITTTGTTFANLSLANMRSCEAGVDEAALPGSKWYMSSQVLNTVIMGLQGGDSETLYRPTDGKRPAMFDGYPIELTSKLPTATAVDTEFIVFGNLQYVLIGDRQTYTIDTSKEATILDVDGATPVNLWQQGMKAIKAEERVDIQVAKGQALALIKTAAS